ncbi:MAG: hypothetical protein OEU32_07710, partial [Acidimicrobiia bacterium]|nr:hypothetical protein [Acidimicrobiia bacterium]
MSVIAGVLAGTAGAATARAVASTFVVDTVADAHDAIVGDGICATESGVCSVRAALEESGAAPGSTVLVPSGTFVLTEGELSISAATTIQGAAAPPGPAASTIDAGGASRVVDIDADDVIIGGVVLTGGNAGNANGGGIRINNNRSLTLVDSTVTGNIARDGGGIDNRGTLSIEASTVAVNTATRKGGGLRNAGVSTLDNVTIVGNVADQGGGVSSPGTTTITHATIMQNSAGSSSSGGVDRNGGSLEISYSIIAGNLKSGGSENRDCSGTPDLVGLNLVSVAQGCNPVDPIIEADPIAGPLAANGGPTETVALLDTSPALDAIDAAACTLATDQRGILRPTGPGCDLGAYEEAPLDATFALDVDTAAYASVDDPLTPDPEVEIGVVGVPTERILGDLIARSEDQVPDGPASTALRSIALRSIEIEDLALRSIDPEATALRSIALRSIPLRSIALRSIALRSIVIDSAALRSIALRSILLSDIPLLAQGGWDAFLAGTAFDGLPLQSVTLEDLDTAGIGLPDDLTLEDINLESTALRSIALRSILLADAALRSIPIPDENGVLQDGPDDQTRIDAWCSLLGPLCGNGPGQIASADLGQLDLLSVQLAGGDVDSVPVFDIPLSSLASTALRSIALRSIPLRSIKVENTALRSIALRSIALRSIADGVDYLAGIVDCSDPAGYCSSDATNSFTLGDVLDPALIGDIGSIADLPADLIEGLSFGDLLLGFVAPDNPAWESFDLDGALLQNIPDLADRQPTFDYVASVTIIGSPADLDVTLTLPAGFAAARGTGDPLATFDGAPIEPLDGDLGRLQFSIPAVGPGAHELVVPARAGLTTGVEFVTVGQVVATAGTEVATPDADTATVNVIEAFEDDGIGAPIPVLTSGELQLAHISRSDDVDLYEFTVPAGLDGASGRILLSNIPMGVDYDLTVYAPVQDPLRNQPTRSLDSVGDIGFDLDPTDDVFPTDLTDDVQLNVPEDRGLGEFSVRDVSTRRSNEDEEVSTGPLVGGQTYHVAVTSYLEDLDPAPYGLRIRIGDAAPLPECGAERTFPNALPPSAIAQPTIPPNVNTLYVTNTQWLTGEVGDISDIIAAVDATAGVNGVVPVLVPVDDYQSVADRYSNAAPGDGGWLANRCDPDARNAVVSEIGQVIDGIVAAHPTVENIVIIGGDGVIPMAAVPDLTEFANESTFALEVTGNGENNEVAAALGAGMLLTDDPYATTAGISIQDGDHELFVPEVNIGRLVETGPEILNQLTHFAQYDGQLDPSTLPGGVSAGVTGYGFLDDGALAVTQELAAAATVTDLTDADNWDRDQFLGLLASQDFGIISPNAHYDFETLLPAAADGTLFDSGDLVSTADVTGSLPTEAVIFSMGCHGGLSVSDVQLGFTSPDWAQTYAAGNNLWVAHTTYGFGDTDIVAFSERLTQIFAANVAALINDDPQGPESVGTALREAKQEYLATTLVLNPYDEKVLQSLTYYGLPMYEVGGTGTAPAAAAAPAAGESSPVAFGSPDTATGITPVDIQLDVTAGLPGPGNLNLVSTEVGDYYEVDGNTVIAQYRAVQPLVNGVIPTASSPAGGLLLTSLTSQDIPGFEPFYLQPTLDSSANEGRIQPDDGSFPATLQRVAATSDGEERLLVAGGQFQDGLDGGTSVQRLFTDIGGELYPAVDTGTDDPPGFFQVIGRVGETEAVAQFEITTDADAQRVFVLFREGDATGPVAWRGLDLFSAPDADP